VARIGFISDIHGNVEALEAVLADAKAVGVDAMVCLGDVVGYGPEPGACVDLVAQNCDVMIRGNHDEAVMDVGLFSRFNPRAWRSVEASRDRLEPGHFALLESMRARGEIAGLALAHGSFGSRRFEYLYDAATASDAIDAMPSPVGFVGHTHLPSAFVLRAGADRRGDERGVEAIRMPANAEIALSRDERAILNPGSVGQPRDRNPDAAWGVFDLDRWTFQARRVAYDVAAVARRMQEMGLAEFHALRLRAGV
jgi:predicted phosphodiesterase